MPAEARCAGNAVEHYLDRHVESGDAARTAFSTASASWTYGELLEQVQLHAGLLRELGVTRGERVAIALADSLEAVAFLLAAMRIGAVAVPIPTQLSADEHAFLCSDCEPAVAVTEGSLVLRMQDICTRLGWPRVILAVDADGERGYEQSAAIPAEAERERRAAIPTGAERECRAAISVQAALEEVTPRIGVENVRGEDPALLQYTSGSTGRPKGVVHLHRGLLALPLGFGRLLDLTCDDVCYSTAKLSFGYGLGNSVLFPLSAGASAHLRAAASDPAGALETIDRVRPTVLFAGPTLYRAMLTAATTARRQFDLSSLRLCVSAGDALGRDLFDAWSRRFGLQILDGLGSTECLHIFMAGEPGRLRADCVGRAIDPYEVRLTDEQGQPVPRGQVGHLHVRGPATFAGYWNRTHGAPEDGWVQTGDLMLLGDDDFFRYVGRSDDVFKVRELKVAPLEIEALLNAHPSVRESGVVGSIDKRGQAIVCAFVCVADGHRPSDELARELRACARSSLSAHKVPRMIRFLDALPRTSTGKLARHRLRALAAEAQTSAPRAPAGR